MKTIHRIGMLAAALATALLAACGQQPAEEPAPPPEGVVQLRGAGATFPAPLYKKWISEYQAIKPDIQIAYEAVGSGEGIKRFIAGTVDFGASDAAMSDAEMARVERGVRLTPATAGMIVLAYNLPGLNGELRLPRDVYVDIFSGKIKDWNDERIQAANPALDLPNKSIVTVVRRDGSGTTFAFTNHLSAVSDEWRDRGPRVGKLIDWPGNSMSAIGNEGVAGRINVSEGAIGYVEYGFAKRLDLPMAVLENQAGNFVKPDAQSGQRGLAGGSEDAPDSLRLFIPDPEGEGAYPLVTYSWLLLYETYPSADIVTALKDFVFWGLNEGQRYAEEMGYIPLPQEITLRALEVVNRIY